MVRSLVDISSPHRTFIRLGADEAKVVMQKVLKDVEEVMCDVGDVKHDVGEVKGDVEEVMCS